MRELVVQIPNQSGWSRERLVDVTKLISRGSAPRYVEKSSVTAIGQRCVTVDGFEGAQGRPHSENYLRDVLPVARGDILLNSTGTGTIGRSCIFDRLGSYVADGHVTVIRVHAHRADERWLQQLLGSSWGQRFLETSCYSGSTNQVELSRERLVRAVLPTPPLAEQRKIAEVLDAVDENIRSTERLIAKLEQARQGVTTELFNRTRSTSDGIPCTWRTLSEVSLFVTDGTHQPVETGSQEQEAVPFVFVSCVRDGAVFWKKAERISRREYNRISAGREISPGMVLYTAVGSYGHAAAVGDVSDFSFQRHIACIYSDRRAIEPRFLSVWLNAREMKKYADSVAIGNAQKTVTLTALACFPIPVPGLDEQRHIVRIANQHRERIDSEKSKLAKLRELKRGLMEDLLTGKVRVNADEVAENL